MSELPVTKSLGCIICVLGNFFFFLPLFVISSVLLFQEDLFFITVKISVSNFLEIDHFLF